jgi:hypothetical protein
VMSGRDVRTDWEARPPGRTVRRRGTPDRSTSCHSLFRARDQRICHLTWGNVGLTRVEAAVRFRLAPSSRSIRIEDPDGGSPGKAVRPTGRTCSYGWEGQLAVRVGRLGRPQSPTKGGTGPDPARARRLLGASEPEGLTVAGGFGFRRAGGPSGSFSAPMLPA